MNPYRLTADAVIVGDGTARIITDGAIDVGANGRIVAVGSAAELAAFDGPTHDVGGLLMPGLVNNHAHSPMSLMRSAGDGLPLQRWLTESVWPREGVMTPDDAWWGMALSSIEMLRCGVTTSVEMYLFEDQIVDAVTTTGARLVLAAGIISALMPDRAQFERRIAAVADFADEHNRPDNGISIGFGPHSVYDLDPDRLAEIAAAAIERDALFHIHLDDTRVERELVHERYGRSATQVLADAGALDARVLAAHAVWIDDTDRRLLGAAGAAVAHCPQSNLKLGSGIADVAAMLAAGITVGVGTDGPASNDNLDLWEELRLAPMLVRGTAVDPQAMSAATALDLATSQSARSAGLDDVGEVRPGAWADIIRLDLDQPAFVPGLPDELFSQVVWAGGAHHVTDVWVGGRQVVAQGECTTIDRHETQRQVRKRGRRLLDRG